MMHDTQAYRSVYEVRALIGVIIREGNNDGGGMIDVFEVLEIGTTDGL